MGSFRSAFPSRYLKAEDLPAPIAVSISRIGLETVGQGDKQERKLVAFFDEQPKGLVLNLINSETIAELVGSEDIDAWPGHALVLYPTKTEFAGKRVPCIRIRETSKAGKAKAKSAPPAPAPDDDAASLDEGVGF